MEMGKMLSVWLISVDDTFWLLLKRIFEHYLFENFPEWKHPLSLFKRHTALAVIDKNDKFVSKTPNEISEMMIK